MNEFSDSSTSESIQMNTKRHLEEAKQTIRDADKLCQEMKTRINQWLKYPSEESQELIKSINEFLNWLQPKKELTKNDYLII